MRALVTGANGFIGSHLLEALLQRGYETRALVRKKSSLFFVTDPRVELTFGDIRLTESLYESVKDVDYIFHLAGVKKARNKESFYEGNLSGTKNMISAVLKVNPKIKKFVYLSSLASIGPTKKGKAPTEEDSFNPVSDYGISKLLGEKACLEKRDSLRVLIVRPPAVYGPRDKDIYIFFRLIKLGILPLFSEEEVYLSLCYVKDLVDALILLAEREYNGAEIYFVADPRIYRWTEIGEIIAQTLGKKIRRIKVSKKLVYTIAFLSEFYSKLTKRETILSRQKIDEITERHWICDVSKLIREAKFEPAFGLAEGARVTTDWYQKEGWL